MKKYRLVDLIVFLKQQQGAGYNNLNILLSILNNKKLTPHNRELLIIETLRFCGLYEDAFFHDNSVFESMPLDFEGEINWINGLPEIPIQTFRCSFLNTRVEFGWIMN